mmetsp:Transcript_17764/g.24555  ORF Transcript_17764/g.24555 Transcript_17764/m.24555 type:complete len:266 (+) Transcript_17764:88-885(+)
MKYPTFTLCLFSFFLVSLIFYTGVLSADVADLDEDSTIDGSKDVDNSENIEEEHLQHILTDMPMSADDVQTYFIFPDNPDLYFVSGQKAEVVVGFDNNGDESLNITQVAGSLNSPMDARIYIQNWTSPVYNTIVNPGDQASFSLIITPDVNLQPRDFLVSLSVFYQSDDGEDLYSSTFYNGTIHLLEPPGFLDMETFFMYFFIVAVVGLIAGALFKALQSAGVVKKSKSRKIETGTRVGDNDNEWLKGTPAMSSLAKKRTVSKKR